MVVAILGHGTVGGGVYELLKNRSDITVKYVLDRSPIAELGAVSVTDFSTILNDGEVDTVVEVKGGLEPAHEYMVAAMRAGKNIVTANKHLLAAYYDELTTLAKETGIGFRTSAAVGGGIAADGRSGQGDQRRQGEADDPNDRTPMESRSIFHTDNPFFASIAA